MKTAPFDREPPFVLVPHQPETRWQKLLRSVRAFFSGHLSSENFGKRILEIQKRGEIEPHSGDDTSLGAFVSVLNQGREGQVHNTVQRPQLGENVGTNRQNVVRIDNRYGDIARLNHFSALGHRSFLLFVDENGEAYAMDGSKWSRKS